MKKFVIVLLALCLVLGGVVGYLAAKNEGLRSNGPAALFGGANTGGSEEAGAAASETDAEGEETAAMPEIMGLDFESIRALHEPDEVVGSVGGRAVTWDEYFYWLHDVGTQAEQYVQTLALYEQTLNWDDKLSADSEVTLAEYVTELARKYSEQLNVIEMVAEQNHVSLTEENLLEMEETTRQTIVGALGPEASDEDFTALLEQEMISRSMYDRLERSNYLYQNSFKAIYGENGEKVSEADAIAYLKDNSYLCATHILFLTMDMSTREALDEETAAQKQEQARAIAEELRAIEDPQERLARFAELKAQYCEDSGKENFPDGYVFLPGAMVAEFENAVTALEEYAVSEPVQSTYGYHIIMRLPLSATMTVDYSDAGTPLDARAICANDEYQTMMNNTIEACPFQPLAGAEIDLMNYLIKK